MLSIEAYHLNATKFITLYSQICHAAKQLISITFTLNPRLNNADILTQYRSIIKEIKGSNLFYYKAHNKDTAFSIHPGFSQMMLAPELTKTINIHLHGILIIDPQYNEYFRNELRRFCWNNQVLGRQFAFNVVNDTLKDRTSVAKYPFKDTDQLLKFPDSAKIYYYNIQEII
jgi:hypothetical protein